MNVIILGSGGKKIIYAPCDVKPFPKSEKFMDADVLIIGNTIVGDVLKNGFVLNEDNPLTEELFTLDDIDTGTVWNQRSFYYAFGGGLGKSYDDYRELEKKLNSIHFAYDGLKIQL